MRISKLSGAAAASLLLVVAVLLGSRASAPPLPAPSPSPPTRAAIAPTNEPSAAMTRALGFHLLKTADAGEIREGLGMLESAAEAGDQEAQVALGRIHLRGIPSVPKDEARARQWFKQAEPHPSAA